MITQQDFFSDHPLYERLKFSVDDFIEMKNNVLLSEESFDCFCIWCNITTPFRHQFSSKLNDTLSPRSNSFNKSDYDDYKNYFENPFKVILNCYCNRKHEHRYYFCIDIGFEDGVFFLEKIGQKPSFADIHQSDFQKFKNILPSEKLREINKAIGLQAHAASIGGFTYLRRVFEYLLEEAYKEAIVESAIDENEYKRRVGKKSKSRIHYAIYGGAKLVTATIFGALIS